MAGNSGSGHVGYVRHQTSAEEMAAFDSLSPELREVLRNSSMDWPCVDIVRRISMGTHERALIARIKSYERQVSNG